MKEERVDTREDLREPENGGTRGGQRPEPDESDTGAGNEYPANGGTRGTAPASTTAA